MRKFAFTAAIYVASIASGHAAELTTPLFAGISIGIPQGIAPPPGLYFGSTELFYSAPRVDGNGNKANTHLSFAETSESLLLSTDQKILGARYYAFASQSVEQSTLYIRGAATSTVSGAFNPYLQPLGLSWALSDRLFVSSGAGVFLPVGSYTVTQRHIANGFTTIQPIFAVSYVYQGVNLTASSRLDLNFANQRTNYKSGDLFGVDFTAAKSFGAFTAGVGGYYVDQYRNDVQNGVIVAATIARSTGNKVKELGLGPYFSYDFKRFAVSAWYDHDVMARNFSRTDVAWVRLSIPIGNPFGPTKAVAPAAIPDEKRP